MAEPRTAGNTWPVVIAGVAIFLAAAGLRLWQLGGQILVDDEWHALHQILYGDGYLHTFLSFGYSDYSIPLTLLFHWISDTRGLHEWHMRALPLAFGVATVAVVPRLFREWTRPGENLTLAGLLAISPLLVHFSRYARPYALSLLLATVAIMALWRFRHGWHWGWGLAYLACTVLAAWLHPLTLALTGPAGLWFAAEAVIRGVRKNDWDPLWRLAALGSLTLGICLALLVPPLVADPAAIEAKAGVHTLNLRAIGWAWELFIGTGLAWLAVAMTGPLVIGGIVLWQRDWHLLAYWGFIATFGLLAVGLLDAAWIHHGLVLARYLLPLLPFLLLLVAIGLITIVDFGARRLTSRPAWLTAPIAAGVLACLFAAGPLPLTHGQGGNFANAMLYQFDYDHDRNAVWQYASRATTPDFYREMESGFQVIDAPWNFATHQNVAAVYQHDHGLPVAIGFQWGLCSDGRRGELPPGDPRFRFRNFVHLSHWLAAPGKQTYVVLHRTPALPEMEFSDSMEPCIQAYRDHFGEPWHEDDASVVFRFP